MQPHEKISRRGQSKREVPSEIEEGIEEVRAGNRAKALEALSKATFEIDGSEKKLTGRKPEVYALESDVPLSELFPPNKSVLNIGDPWQVIDFEGVTTIEYESGEEAEFIHDSEDFLQKMPDSFQSLFNQINEDVDYAKLRSQLSLLQDKFNTTDVSDYDEYGDQIIALCKLLPKQYIQKAERDFYYRNINIWHALQRLGRGFKDVWLNKCIIDPAVEKERVLRIKEGGLLTEEEETNFRQRLIEEHRFVRKTKRTELIKGVFPDVPCEDKSFDRLVASSSISRHMFPVMTEADFMIYFDEIDRLLKKDGVCYIWPIILHTSYDEDNLINSLRRYLSEGGDACILVEKGNRLGLVWINDISFAPYLSDTRTLIIFPRNATRVSRKRVTDILERELTAEEMENEDLAA